MNSNLCPELATYINLNIASVTCYNKENEAKVVQIQRQDTYKIQNKEFYDSMNRH